MILISSFFLFKILLEFNLILQGKKVIYAYLWTIKVNQITYHYHFHRFIKLCKRVWFPNSMSPLAIYVFIKFEGGSVYPRGNSDLLHSQVWLGTSDPPECWNHKCMSPNPVYVALRIQSQGLCLLGKQPTPAATSMLPLTLVCFIKPYQFNSNRQQHQSRAGNVAEIGECFPGMHEAFGSNLGKLACSLNPSTREAEWRGSEVEVILGYILDLWPTWATCTKHILKIFARRSGQCHLCNLT